MIEGLEHRAGEEAESEASSLPQAPGELVQGLRNAGRAGVDE